MNLETDNKIQKKEITLVIPNPCGNIKETKMKNSGVEWIGEIPDDWGVKKFKYFFDIYGGSGFKEEYQGQEKGDFPFCKASDINGTEKNLTTARNYVSQELVDKESYIVIPKNSILVSKIGEALKKNHRKVNLVNCIVDNNCEGFVLNTKNDINYLYYVLKCIDMSWFDNGGTIPSVNNFKLKNFCLPNCLYETQQRIASYLDIKCSKIEEIIQNQQQVIEKLKAYKQSLITEAVTGKIKIKNGKVCGEYESYKDSGVEWIGKIPSEWEVKKLKFSSQIMRGLFSHRPRNDPDYYDGVHPFIQTGEVARTVKYITTYSQTLNELGFSVSREFPAGTVLLTIAANVGDVAILDFNACFPDSVIGFYPKENVSKIFMFYVLKSMKEQFMRNAIISTQMNLNINIVKEEFIPLPSLAEQKEIVKFLEKKSDYIDTAIEQKQKLIEKLTEYKKSLIYECVTGKKEI